MKTLLQISDKTEGKLGASGDYWPRPYNIVVRARAPSSHLEVPRERKGEDGI